MFLNIPKHQREELKEVLDILISEGKVGISKKGKYGKPDESSPIGIFCGHAKASKRIATAANFVNFSKVPSIERALFLPQ